MSDFLTRTLPVVQKPVHRLGLACNYGIDEKGFEAALERGINYIFWTTFRVAHIKAPLKAALARNREKLVFVSGVSPVVTGWELRRAVESNLRTFNIDYIDIFQLFWVGVMASANDWTLEALEKLKEEGKIRASGCSIHDRPRAGSLAQNSKLDMFMLRYNLAHPGCERETFPHITDRHIVTAYTATSWGRLLKPPAGWSGPSLKPADCYRFALSHPKVSVVLCGPKSQTELEENLDGLERGPLSPEEDAWMRDYGKKIHG